MPDPLESSRQKLARGKHHIQDLEAKIKAFSDGEPYDVSVEPDPKVPDKRFHRVNLIMPLPAFFSDIAGDAVNNLRSALDHAGYGVAVACGKVNPKNAYFPIAGSAAHWEANAKGRCKDIPQDIVTFFRGLKPYKGGNDLLWGLNEICVGDKHIKLVPVGVTIGGSNFGTAYKMGTGVSYTRPTWDGSKNEVTFTSIQPDGAKLDYGFKFVLAVAFSEIQLFAGQPAISVLNRLASEVERVLLGIEAEARRLGFIT